MFYSNDGFIKPYLYFELMAELRWLPSLDFPVSSKSMAKVRLGIQFGLITLLAFGLALFTSFEALISNAGLAGMSAAVLSQPNAGAVFAKSYARLFGTVSGGMAAVALFWVFPQAPWLFAAGMALWMGTCAYWGGKFKYFASYATVLAGYTAAMVAMNTSNPESVITVAGERVSVIIIGILSVAFVFGVFHIRKGFKAYLPPLREMNDSIIAQAKEIVKDPGNYDHVKTMRQWANDIGVMHQSMEYASAEDSEVALHARSIRCGLNELFADIADFNIRLKELNLLLEDASDRAFSIEVNQKLLEAFETRLAETDEQTDQRMVDLKGSVIAYFATQKQPHLLNRSWLLAEINAAKRLLTTMNRIRRGRTTFDEEDVRPLGQATTWRQNLYNGMVVAFTFMVAWGIYIVDEWQTGGMMFVVMVSALMCIVSVAEDPAMLIKGAQIGVLGCLVPAVLCDQVLMPLGSGFPWLVLCFSVVIIPCCILQMFPRTQGIGTLFMLFGMMLSLPNNQMSYDLQTFLNNLQALLAASALSLAAVLIFYPIRNRGKAQRVERHAFRELSEIPRHLRKDRFSEWEDRQQERVGVIDRIATLKGTVVAKESTEKLLLMMRMARCFRRQHLDLQGIKLPDSVKSLIEKLEWFWARQLDNPDRFRLVTKRLIDALELAARDNPSNEIELLAAVQEWRMIAKNNEVLASQPC